MSLWKILSVLECGWEKSQCRKASSAQFCAQKLFFVCVQICLYFYFPMLLKEVTQSSTKPALLFNGARFVAHQQGTRAGR